MFVLSKLLFIFLMPLTWIIFLLAAGIFIKNSKLRKRALFSSMTLLIFFTNPFILNKVLLKVEYPIINISNLEPTELGVILTGFTQRIETEDNRVFLSKDADRATHMVYLYNSKKVKKVLITGGSGAIDSDGEISESQKSKNLLIELGIPAIDILIEEKSRNTYENAKFSATIIKENSPNSKPILLTSSSHMKRSIACFKKQGIEVTPVAGDYNSRRIGNTGFGDFLPNGGVLGIWGNLFHEWIGIVYYKLRGYI